MAIKADIISLLAKRLGLGLVTLLVVSLVIFIAVESLPGDFAEEILGQAATEESVAAIRKELGLDQPAPLRYLDWIAGMAQGDFGTSYTYRSPVSELVADRLWVSLPLTIYALILSTAIAIPAGVLAAANRGGPADYGVMGITQLGVAIPNFWFAILLVVVFAITLRWVGAGGFPGWEGGLWPALKALTLPAIALALPQASILARTCSGEVLAASPSRHMP